MAHASILGWARTTFGKLEVSDVESLTAYASGEALAHE